MRFFNRVQFEPVRSLWEHVISEFISDPGAGTLDVLRHRILGAFFELNFFLTLFRIGRFKER